MGQYNNPYWATMSRVAAQNCTSGVATLVQCDTIVNDPAAMCTIGAAAKITVPVSGLYWVNAIAQFNSLAVTNAMVISINKNGSLLQTIFLDTGVAFNNGVNHQAGTQITLIAGDNIQLFVQQNTGSTLSCAGTQFSIDLQRFL